MGKTNALSWRSDHGSGTKDNSDMMLLRPELFIIRAIEGLTAEVKNEKSSETFAKHSEMGKRRIQSRRLLPNFAKDTCNPSMLPNGPNKTDSCSSEARCMSRTILNFAERLCPNTMTPEWQDTQAGGRHLSSCLAITGGHRCPNM